MQRLETGDAFVLGVGGDARESMARVGLEVRRQGNGLRVLSGRFPYNQTATISNRGRGRKETIAARAFRYTVEGEQEEINLLVGHDYGKPLASKRAGSMKLADSDEALTFEAELPDKGPSWMEDAVLALEGGLMVGVSPGFQVPPLGVVPDAEVEIPEPGNPDVTIRVINHALLRELSLVTRPAYTEAGAAVESRAVAYNPSRRRLWL